MLRPDHARCSGSRAKIEYCPRTGSTHLTSGKEMYVTYCAAGHGREGKGRTRGRRLESTAVRLDASVVKKSWPIFIYPSGQHHHRLRRSSRPRLQRNGGLGSNLPRYGPSARVGGAPLVSQRTVVPESPASARRAPPGVGLACLRFPRRLSDKGKGVPYGDFLRFPPSQTRSRRTAG